MFALTFLTVLLSLLSVYAQIVLASPRLDSKLAIGQSMLTWHNASASIAANVISPATAVGGGHPLDIIGCRLSQRTWPGAPILCQTGPNVTPANAVATVNLGPYKFGTASVPYIPAGYNIKNFQWNSILFQAGATYSVITFVSAPSASNVTTAGPNPIEINITKSELFKQFSSLLPGYAYGYVTNGVLMAGSLMIAGTLTPTLYAVPPSVPDGALAIISSPGQCSGC